MNGGALKKFRGGVKRNQAFTRLDLITLVTVAGLLGSWFVYLHAGERGRRLQCAANLRVLGGAMHNYANERSGAIPPAGVESPQMTWDLLIAQYLESTKSVITSEKQLSRPVAARYSCPADPLHRGERPRTFAMSFHNMTPQNWPPGPDNATGVGLWWDSDSMTSLLGQVTTNVDELSLVKLTWFPEPANTILLTEYPNVNNWLGHVDDVRVQNPNEQMSGLAAALAQMHRGRFNYLMADGHVEPLTALQTGGIDGTTGSWSIKAGD
jgi:prepilin-type processing-associated H-X9-DG protein